MIASRFGEPESSLVCRLASTRSCRASMSRLAVVRVYCCCSFPRRCANSEVSILRSCQESFTLCGSLAPPPPFTPPQHTL